MTTYSKRNYETGLCGEFAVALHRVHGLPLGIVWDESWDEDYDEWGGVLAHAFAFLPEKEGWVVDARGARPLSVMLAEIHHAPGHRLRVAPTTEEELDMQSMEGLWPDAVEQAAQAVRSWPLDR